MRARCSASNSALRCTFRSLAAVAIVAAVPLPANADPVGGPDDLASSAIVRDAVHAAALESPGPAAGRVDAPTSPRWTNRPGIFRPDGATFLAAAAARIACSASRNCVVQDPLAASRCAPGDAALSVTDRCPIRSRGD